MRIFWFLLIKGYYHLAFSLVWDALVLRARGK
jgi:hypothetical protein